MPIKNGMKEIKRLLKNYTFIDILRLFRDKLFTILFFEKGIRIIRHPFYIIGKKHIRFGKKFQSGPRLRIEVIDSGFAREIIELSEPPSLIIGDNVSFNFNVHIGIVKKVTIGNNVLIGSNVSILDHNHGAYTGDKQDNPDVNPRNRKLIPSDVFIGNNVWISDNVVILPGAFIGDGCVVGANAVVKGSFLENQIIAGAPAKVIKQFNKQKKIWEEV